MEGQGSNTESHDDFSLKGRFVIEDYTEWLGQFQLAKKTIKARQNTASMFVKEQGELEQEKINRFLKKHPWRRHAVGLSYLFSWDGWTQIARNPWIFERGGRRIRVPKIKEPDPKPKQAIPRERLKEIIESVDNRELRSLLRIYYYTGRRCSEALKLRPMDMDFETGKIRFQEKGGLHGEGWVKPEHLREVKEWIVDVKGVLEGERCFFTEAPSLEAAEARMRRLIDKLPEDQRTVISKTHAFRRAAINYIYDRTGSIDKAQHGVGHRSRGTTMGYIYDHTKEKLRREGQSVLNEEESE